MRKIINNIARVLAVALVCITGTLPLAAQQRTVTGTVVDAEGNPLVGAVVMVTSDTGRYSIAAEGGSFSVQAAAGETLLARYLGYVDTVVPAAQTTIVITMEPDSNTLEEVVVVGYGTQRRTTLTGAVSTVSSREIAATKNENVVNMLSGKIPGVRINQSSSQPGNFDDTMIDIRGFGRTNNNGGMDNKPMFVVDGIVRDQGYFSRMNAADIENISVLKDGSAAVYGVDAGNGVILITTKRGTSTDGKFNVSLSTNFGWQNFLYIPETNNAAAHMILMNEKQYNNFGSSYPVRGAPRYSAQEMLEYTTGKKQSTNWVDELFQKNVPQRQYTVSVDGGNETVSTYFNIGFMDQEGSYRSGSLNYKRWNIRSNTDIKITERLRTSISLGGYLDEKNEPNTGIWTVYKKAWTYRPIAQAWLDDAKTLPALDEFLESESENPVATTNSDYTGYRRDRNTNVDASLSMTYDIPGVKGLNIRGLYNYGYNATNNKHYLRKYYTYAYGGEDGTTLIPYANNGQPVLTRRTDPSFSETYSISLNYAGSFGDHNVGGTLVWEERQGSVDGFLASRNMSLDGEYLMYGEPTDQTAAQGDLNEWARRAMVGRATYNYKERYMAEFAFRYEAASNFPRSGMWELFPSGSVAWRVSEEPFAKQLVPFLNNLKLRASYGVMGGGSGYSRQVMGYEISENHVGWYYPDYMIGVKPLATPNLDLTWTTMATSNIGLDFEMWNGKLSGSFDLFQRVQTGLQRQPDTQIPTETGAPLPNQNLDSDKTFGWEILLGHRNQIGSVRYWVNAQLSAVQNRWISRQDSDGDNSSANYRRTDVSGRNKDIWFSDREEGGRLYNWDDIRYHPIPLEQGFLPGDYWYEDWNGDGVINGDDSHPVAKFQLPMFNYGINLGASWNGFDLAMTWQGSAGVYSSYGEVFTEVGPFGGGASLDFYLDRWRTVNVNDDPWNPDTKWVEGLYPATGHSFSTGTSGIRNASYIRLKSLELGYTLPNKWLGTVGVKDIRVYVNGYNLLTFSPLKNIDPERPGGAGSLRQESDPSKMEASLYYRYPVNRTINVGASLKF